jgi:hypothetical protein
MAHNREQPGKKNSTGFVPSEPLFGLFQLFRTNKDEPTISYN